MIIAGICLNSVSQTLAIAFPDPFDDDKTPAQHGPPYAESIPSFMDFLVPYNRQTNGDGSPLMPHPLLDPSLTQSLQFNTNERNQASSAHEVPGRVCKIELF